jgi:antitoxin component of MazEF toxin-antitoxin module
MMNSGMDNCTTEKLKYNYKYNYIGGIIMSEVVVVARKWGNSIGITLPKEIAEKENINESDKLIVDVKRIMPIKDLFGTFKTNKSAQELKDEMRNGWE